MRLILLFLTVLSLNLPAQDNLQIKSKYFKSYDYEQMGKYSEAIKVLAPLYDKYPKGYTLNLRFGWLFFQNKNYNDAAKYYRQASLIKGYAIDPKLGLIAVALRTASYTEAENIAHEILKLDFYNYYANRYLISALLAQKKYDVAREIIGKMLSLYPTDISFLEQLAVVYKAQNSPYLAQLYEDILILDPNNVYVRSQQH